MDSAGSDMLLQFSVHLVILAPRSKTMKSRRAARAKKNILLVNQKLSKNSHWLSRSTRRRAAPSVDLSASSVEVGHPLIFIVPVATYIEILVFIIQF